jgi:hypothetical protein
VIQATTHETAMATIYLVLRGAAEGAWWGPWPVPAERCLETAGAR